ncbi:MAG: phosphoglucomutase/phosphomannomutase family protein [Deltaproteobacteria bacterium]|nr:phosphoglucomutase/phosphomannomutase family protein [Deltaproteobacteria bacterium]
MPIHFGTDGWRAIVGEAFTQERVAQLIQSFCELKKKFKEVPIVLGYDRRFASDRFANTVAEVLLGNGFSVKLSQSFCPTPVISWLTKEKKALAGIVVTASHNPYYYNGIKFKEPDGGAASPQYTQEIEERFAKLEKKAFKIKSLSLEEGKKLGRLQYFDPQSAYLKRLKSLVDFKAIEKIPGSILVDSMHGAGSGFLKSLLGKKIIEFREEENPSFGGVHPEPIAKNLSKTAQQVLQHQALMALATDGDADRIGALDEKGLFVDSHQIFSLILRHLVEVKSWKGTVVKSVTTTERIRKMAKYYGLDFVETPVGFKHICQAMRQAKKPLIGGEESGGISVAKHVLERDGVFSGLMLLEILATQKKPLSKMIKDLDQQFGPHYFERLDLNLKEDKKKSLLQALKKGLKPSVKGRRLEGNNFSDGYKYYYDDGSWLMLRASGTEPLLRVYAESESPQKTRLLLKTAELLLKKF